MNIDAIKKYHHQLGEALENLSNAEAQLAKLNAGAGVGIKKAPQVYVDAQFVDTIPF